MAGRGRGAVMAKKGMKRPERTHTQPRNQMAPVPELQGKAKHTKKNAAPIIDETIGSNQSVLHEERPADSGIYPVIDTDLARDNVENDMPAADRQDLS